jgi:hypothetical protein
VNKVPKVKLLQASQAESNARRAALLYLAVHRVLPEWAKKPARKKPAPYTHRRLKGGGIALEIREPTKLDRETARDILARLEPVLEALRERAGLEEQGEIDLRGE